MNFDVPVQQGLLEILSERVLQLGDLAVEQVEQLKSLVADFDAAVLESSDHGREQESSAGVLCVLRSHPRIVHQHPLHKEAVDAAEMAASLGDNPVSRGLAVPRPIEAVDVRNQEINNSRQVVELIGVYLGFEDNGGRYLPNVGTVDLAEAADNDFSSQVEAFLTLEADSQHILDQGRVLHGRQVEFAPALYTLQIAS